jgi:hypothetical protein
MAYGCAAVDFAMDSTRERPSRLDYVRDTRRHRNVPKPTPPDAVRIDDGTASA